MSHPVPNMELNEKFMPEFNEKLKEKFNEEQVRKIALETVREYNRSGAFIDRQTTDTPKDAFSPVNRRFVTLSSNIGARPISSVAVTGQPFFDTTSSIPMTYDGVNWRNGVGSVVAGGRNS